MYISEAKKLKKFPLFASLRKRSSYAETPTKLIASSLKITEILPRRTKNLFKVAIIASQYSLCAYT